MSPGEFCGAAMVYCLLTRASVTSFGRTPARQAKLDPAVKYSPHVYWRGLDVVYDDKPPEDGVVVAQRLGLKLIREGDHDHLQPLDWQAG